MNRLISTSLALFLTLVTNAAFANNPDKTVSEKATPKNPNILLLVAEDLSPRIGAFGDALALTPNIDKLAEQSVRYTNVFTAAGVCAPSRAGLITGVHPNAIGAGGMRTSDFQHNGGTEYRSVPPVDVKAFPELLRKAGYWTYENSKLDYQFSGPLPEQGPFTLWDAEAGSTQGVYWNEREEGKPFFGMYAFLETHESGLLPRWDFSNGILPSVMGVMQWYWHLGTKEVIQPEDVTVPPYLPDSPGVRETIAQQYNNTITMDRVVGEILEQLKKDGLAEDTIVIWTTDHGDGFPRIKREANYTSLKVPMTIYWPEKWRPEHIKPGTVDNQLISFIDIAPTILAIAGAEKPDFLMGNDFSVKGGGGREHYFAAADRVEEAAERVRTVSDGRFKLMRNYRSVPSYQYSGFRSGMPMMKDLLSLHKQGKLNEDQEQFFQLRPYEQLFDTLNDPYELKDLAQNPDYKKQWLRLQKVLNEWQGRVKDYGEIPEKELALQFWPNGIEPITETPVVVVKNNKVTLTAKDNASIGYKIDDGEWLLYSLPLNISKGSSITAKAVRYGWGESEEVELTL